MVETVQRFATGDLHTRMPASNTTELAVLAEEFDHMAAALERAEAERCLRMDKARRIQDNLRPDLGRVESLRSVCIFEPAAEVAGDYCDVVDLAHGSLLPCIADVTGHGVPAAMLKTLLHTLARREGPILALPATGPPLGVDEQAEWEDARLQPVAGDRLVLFTDGLIEAASPDGEQFGLARLEKIIKETLGRPLADLRDKVIAEAEQFRGPGADDLTVLAAEFAVARRPAVPGRRRNEKWARGGAARRWTYLSRRVGPTEQKKTSAT